MYFKTSFTSLTGLFCWNSVMGCDIWIRRSQTTNDAQQKCWKTSLKKKKKTSHQSKSVKLRSLFWKRIVVQNGLGRPQKMSIHNFNSTHHDTWIPSARSHFHDRSHESRKFSSMHITSLGTASYMEMVAFSKQLKIISVLKTNSYAKIQKTCNFFAREQPHTCCIGMRPTGEQNSNLRKQIELKLHNYPPCPKRLHDQGTAGFYGQ